MGHSSAKTDAAGQRDGRGVDNKGGGRPIHTFLLYFFFFLFSPFNICAATRLEKGGDVKSGKENEAKQKRGAGVGGVVSGEKRADSR